METHDANDIIRFLKAEQDPLPINVVILEFKDDDLNKYKKIALTIRSDKQYDTVKLIGIMNSPRRGDAQKMKKYGYNGYLTKPIKHSHLYNTLRMLKDKKMNKYSDNSIITKHLTEELLPEKVSVLVVEDNVLNQKVMTKMLNRYKIRVDIVENGIEAIQAIHSKKYDMVFMDCKLPVMDGYKTTMKIRESELNSKAQGKERRLPIVAVTADALAKNREKCLLAGMDEFLTKPIKSKHIEEILIKYFDEEN